jgi:NADH:ubiquinone oxidoreductase subunit 4 (subunit M)
MLSALLLIPLLGSFLLLLWPGNPPPGRMRSLALVVLVAQLVWNLVVLRSFNPVLTDLQLVETLPWLPGLGLEYRLGIDGLSLPLLLINSALSLVTVVCTRDISQRPRLYFALVLIISGAVNGAFMAGNLLLFFLFYELELIPLWLLISIWGGVDRAATCFLKEVCLGPVAVACATPKHEVPAEPIGRRRATQCRLRHKRAKAQALVAPRLQQRRMRERDQCLVVFLHSLHTGTMVVKMSDNVL